jgi:potassium efflux system protein
VNPPTFADFWNHELFRIRSNSLTVGDLTVAVLLVVFGFLASRALSRLGARLLVKRFHVDVGSAKSIETISFYLLLISFVLTSLTLVNFPLTVFTIVGGALAIGAGFGSQNVMNNFISGLILNVERPIRAGDLVEVQGTHGVVEAIGARSTRIRASDNTQVIVPNSFLLENKVVNFTLSDDVVRTEIEIGVIYGSPTRDVERIALEVIGSHERVISEPAPRILFASFGDNALVFRALFWLHARTMLERRQVESDVRFQVDDRFRQAGIVIAFPQRDVHLDSTKPLEVRVVTEPGSRGT